MGVLADLIMLGRYATGLPRFLRRTISPAQAEAMARRSIAERTANFLRIVERGIFGHPRSPYLPLLQRAGWDLHRIRETIGHCGLEDTLRALLEAGVYVNFEEFKGRQPIARGGHVQPVQSQDFDNPLLVRHYEVRTGGSRGVGTRFFGDLDLLTHEAAAHSLFLRSFQVEDRPFGLWRPLPPGAAGLVNVLRHAKLGKSVDRWFTQSNFSWQQPADWKSNVITYYTVHASRFWARRLPPPEHVPLGQAHRVARWLAGQCARGTPPLFDTNASSGVRICLAAQEHGLDISRTFFRFGGEPYTEAKARVVAETGCRAASAYSMAEIGRIGIPCEAAAAMDDVHVLTNKLAVIQQERPVGPHGTPLPVFLFTTLHPSAPTIMLNVVTDDYGMLEERPCGCPLFAVGFRQHIHTIRSYEKLNSEGMTFYGFDILKLVEEVLPNRFGGQPIDYQFVETEEGGLPKVGIIVSPRVGEVDEAAVLATVVNALRQIPDGVMMTARWLEGQTLRVHRRVPYVTPASKTLPLHILRRT